MKKPEFEFNYKESLPNEEIDHLVFGFFEFSIQSDSAAPFPYEVFPDGCVSLLYRRNKRLNIEMLLIKGLSLKTFHTDVFGGDVHWGVRFAPAACARILNCDPGTIQTQPVINNEIVPRLAKDILPQMSKCKSFEEAVIIFEKRLKRLGISKEEIDETVAEAVRMIEERKGEIKMAEIVEKVGIGRRQLERRFRKHTGITLKQLARTYRLRATAINLIEKDMNWANRAAEMGFADQSHLSRELENLTGRKPKSFGKRISDVDHKNLIK